MTGKSQGQRVLKSLGIHAAAAALLYALPLTGSGARGLSDSVFLVGLVSLLYHTVRLIGCLHLFDRTAESFRKFIQLYKGRPAAGVPGDHPTEKTRRSPDLVHFGTAGAMLLLSALLAVL